MSPQSDSGNESAEQQLFAELQASASKLQQPPSTSAIRSANLLNAARVDRRRTIAHTVTSSPPSQSTQPFDFASSPIDMVRRKGDAGKLKRPSFLREDMARQPRLNLARRGDIFEMAPDSPEKSTKASPFELPQTVNRKPLKRAKRGKVADVENENHALHSEHDAAHISSLVAGEDSHDLHKGHLSRRKGDRLAGDAADVARIDFAKKPGFRSQKEKPTKRKADEQLSQAERSPKSPRTEDHDASEQVNGHSAAKPGRNLRSRAKRTDPQVVIPARNANKPSSTSQTRAKIKTSTNNAEGQLSPQLRDEDVELGSHDTASPRAESPLFEPEQQITKPAMAGKTRATKNSAKSKIDTAPARRAGRQTLSQVKQVKQRTDQFGDDTIERSEPRDDPESDNEGRLESPIDPPSEDEESNDLEEEEEHHSLQDDDISLVFKFLDSEERRGKCKTKDAVKISRACQTACELFQQPDLTLKKASDTTLDITAMLANRGVNKDEDDLRNFKIDAYGYLFRDLIGYLEGLHGWLENNYGDVSQSLKAMEIVAPFVLEIISFKDTIASWKAKIPTRYQNDRLIKDVDTRLIVPLRRVGTTYRAIWSQLQRAHDPHSQERQRRFEEQARRKEEAALRRKRWQRWQDLHMSRQLCEPDHFLRRRLFIDSGLFASKFENTDERDANGIKFERVPLFKERVSPAVNQGSPSAEEDWTDEQMAALVDGLTNYAGPGVFPKIFKKYCRPGGVLRKFTVPDITAQATSVRTHLLNRYQSEGWEVPDWISLIPVLP